MGGLVALLGIGVLGLLVAQSSAKKARAAESPAEIPGLSPELAREVDRLLRTVTDPAELQLWADKLREIGETATTAAAELLENRATRLEEAAEAGESLPDLPEPPDGFTPVAPTEAELDEWAALSDDLVMDAVSKCPAAEPQIRAAHDAFVAEFVAAPLLAYNTLLATVQTHCPNARDPLADPTTTDPGGIPDEPDATEPPTPAGLASDIVESAAQVGCENLSPELVAAFQEAVGVSPSGVYDFPTAVEVQTIVAQAGGTAPAPCRFPELETMAEPAQLAILNFAERLEQAIA